MTMQIKIKKGAGTPSGLTFGELAYDLTNKKLFIGITGGNALLANTDGGVATFNGLTGAIGLSAGTGITFSISGNTLTIASSGGGGGVALGDTNIWTALNTFSAGISASSGVTFSADITVNGHKIGRGAGNSDTNIVVGRLALGAGSTGTNVTAVGVQAADQNTGNSVLAFGYQAAYANTANTVVSIGYQSGVSNTGTQSVFVGTNAGNANTGVNAVAIGHNASTSNIGANVVSVGAAAGAAGSGDLLVAIGSQAGYGNAGYGSVAIGGYAMLNSTSGNRNTAIGSNAMDAASTATNNTSIGAHSLGELTTGASNVAVGGYAGDLLTTGSDNVILGFEADVGASADSNSIVIGKGAVGLGSNTTVIGVAATTAATIYGRLNLSSGLSASGGVTLAGTLQGTTAAFTGLVSSTVGFSGPATNLSGSATGLTAGTATNVIITDNNGSTEQYLTFVTGTGGTGLRIDKTTTPLTYTPSTSTLKLGTGANFLSLTPSYIETGGAFSIAGAGGLYFEDYTLLSFGDVNQEQSKMLFEILPTTATKYARLYIPDYASNATLLVNRLTPVGTHAFEVNRSDGKAAKLIYGDTGGTASNYVDLDVSSGGNLTITPSGSLVTITGRLDVSAGISAASGVTFSGNVAMTSTSSHTGLARFAGGLSASSGVTFNTNISVNSISVGRGKGNVTTNTALGTGVLSVLTPDEDYFIGTFNTGLGSQALNILTTGQRNTAVGTNALYSATTSSYNTAVGAIALYSNTTGSYNTAIGEESLRYNTTGVENVGIGYDTLLNLTTASYNTAVGVGAGRARGSGSAYTTMISATGGIFIGHQARGSTSGQTNEIVIGRDAVGLGSNTTVLGATSAVSATIYGLVNAPSGISAAGSTFSGNVNLQDNTLSRIELLDYCERFVDLGDFASKSTQIPIDLSTAQVFRTKLTTASTGLSVTNTPDNANANTVGFTLLFVGDGTARTMTWNIGSTAIGWAGGIAPTYTSTLNKIDVYSFLTRDGGSNWLGFVGGQNF